MSNHKWKDSNIETILKNMPSIKDERTKEAVYHSVQAQMERKKKRIWILPSIASVLAVSLLFIIGLSYSNFFNKGTDNFQMASSPSSERKNSEEAQTNSHTMESADQNIASKEKIETVNANSIYKEEIGDKEVLTYPIPDENVQVIVPVSILVDNTKHLSKFELYKQYIRDVINQTKWKLSDYLPINPSKFTYDEAKATINVNFDESLINIGSHSEEFFQTFINQQLETIGAEKIAFYSQGKEGVVLGNREETEINYKPLVNRAYFLLDSTRNEQEILYVPWEKPFTSIKDALQAMKNDVENYGLSASIPTTINFEEITENSAENQLILYLTDESKLEDTEKSIEAIECILLTAKEFNYQSVKFENITEETVGDFNLSDELEVPVAANNVDL